MAHKLDIFETLAAIDRRDHDFLSRKTEEERKGFAAVVVQRWASATGDGDRGDLSLYLVNEYANINFYDLYDHPDLQYKLLASTGLGSKMRHEWIPMPKVGKAKGGKLFEFLREHWPDANETELNILLRQFDRAGFEEFVNGCGMSPDDIKETLNAYDSYYGQGTKAKSKSKSKARR